MSENAGDLEQSFSTKRIFVKDFSFEAPGGANTFTSPWDPDVTVDVDVTKEALGNDHHEVTLTLTITVSNAGATAFMLEIFQCGIFQCSGFQGGELHRVLHTICPNLLFPYAAEAVDGMALKGSFPALTLQPVNFDALYRQNVSDDGDRED